MRISGRGLAGLLLSVLFWAWAVSGPAVAIDRAGVDKKLAAAAAYKPGAGRESLIAVEQLIRQSQRDAEQQRYIENALARLLETDVSTECKEFICSQLSFIGTADSIPAIAKLLADENTADMACYAIGRNPSKAAGKALRDALGSSSPAVQIRIVNLLGDRKDTDCVPALGKFVVAGRGETALSAVGALGKIGGEKATEILAGARANGIADLQLAATDAYLQCAENLVDKGKNAEALAIYKELAGKNEAAFTRTAAIQGLADIGGTDAVTLVVGALKDANRMVKTTARGCVRTMQGEGVTELFAAELEGGSPGEKILLIAALGDRGDAAALDEISKAVKSSDVEIRIAALGAVGKLGGVSSVEFLVEAARMGTSVDEKKAAIVSLTILAGPGVDDAIVKSMQRAETLRVQLIGVLSDRNAVGAVGPLLAEAAGGDSKVRRAAFKAMGRLGRQKDLPSLLSLLTDIKGGSGRKDAEKAVVAVSRRIPDVNEQADAIIARLPVAERVEVRSSLLRVLGGIGNDKALGTVRVALKDADVEVRDTAVRTLAAWPSAASAQALLGIYRDSKNQVHRLLSLRGLVRVLSISSAEYPPEQAVGIYSQAAKSADAAQEKKLVLSGLSNVAHSEALEMALAFLDDEDVQVEAALAAVKIAAAIAPNNQSKARAAAKKVLSMTNSETVRKQAEELIAEVDRLRNI